MTVIATMTVIVDNMVTFKYHSYMSTHTTASRHKQYAPDSYYHIYARGLNKQEIFLDEDDYSAFLNMVKILLSPEKTIDAYGRVQTNFSDGLELLTYALMPNHFHMLVYQSENERSIVDFMRSLMTRYGKYFNKKYHRIGPVFQGRYAAKLISDEAHLYHISRYIHMNPRNWQNSTTTSLDFYMGKRGANWIKPAKILGLFPSRDAYMEFLKDYDPERDELFSDIEPDY
jgi:REP element-mobilizing transposase RayT